MNEEFRDVKINFEELCKRLKIRVPTPYEMGIEYSVWDNMSPSEKEMAQNEWFRNWVSNKTAKEAQYITQVILQLMCDTDKTYKRYLKKKAKQMSKVMKGCQ